MKNKRNSNVAYYVSIIIIILFFGCSAERGHKTLTFFFDGVNKVIFFNDYLSKDSLSKESVAKREALLKKNRPEPCVHKPYKEKNCEACHTPDKHLLSPMPGLCFKCHTNFNEKYKIVHGPVASGACLNCHNQHSSKYAKLLIRQGQQICLFCHNSSLVFANKVHKDIEDAECTLCHNPHGGKSRFMLKENVSRESNRIALMEELTYRHLYGQVFCKVARDINKILDISIIDGKGKIVSVSHLNDSGKFYLSNLHPDQNYTFKSKNEFPDCSINIMDNNGTVLFVVEKNKKGKYAFDREAYETVHTAINDAHYLGENIKTGIIYNNITSINTDQPVLKETNDNHALNSTNNNSETTSPNSNLSENKDKNVVNNSETVPVTAVSDNNIIAKEPIVENKVADIATNNKGKIVVKSLPDSISTKDLIEANLVKDTATKEKIGENAVAETVPYQGKIKVENLPANSNLKKLTDAANYSETVSEEQATQNKGADVSGTAYKGKIVVKTLPDNDNNKNALKENKAKETIGNSLENVDNKVPAITGNKGKMIVNSLPVAANENAPGIYKPERTTGITDIDGKYQIGGIALTDLSRQLANNNDGTIVCIINNSANYFDIANVNSKGEFRLNDFLSFRMNMPAENNSIVTQTVFLNDKMEIIETVNKRVSKGRFVYTENSREPVETRFPLKITANKENAVSFSSVYFDEEKATISPEGISGLEKVIEDLRKNPKSKAYLTAYSDSKKSVSYNLKLSESRARAAIDYIVSKGINRNRITSKGFGKTKPLNTHEVVPVPEEVNKKNRKVEIYIKDN